MRLDDKIRNGLGIDPDAEVWSDTHLHVGTGVVKLLTHEPFVASTGAFMAAGNHVTPPGLPAPQTTRTTNVTPDQQDHADDHERLRAAFQMQRPSRNGQDPHAPRRT